MTVKLHNWFRFLIIFFIVTLIFVVTMDQFVLPRYVSHGKELTMVDVRDSSYTEAKNILLELGFQAIAVDTLENTELPPETVIDQQPLPGAAVKQGRIVRLVITSGERFFPMPNLVGKVLKAAQLELDRQHLNVSSTTEEFSSDKPPGVVTRQSIRPGLMVSSKDTLELVISKGLPPSQLEVPDLFGMNLDEAKAAIRKAGFKIGTIRYIPNDELVAYTVIRQNPEWGTLLDNPVLINLEVTIASHPE